MTSAKLIFWLMCLEKFGEHFYVFCLSVFSIYEKLKNQKVFFSVLAQTASMESLNWKTNVILVKPGQNLTLPCHDKDDVSTRIYWFKQTLGEKPRLICTYRISSEDWKFVNDFKTNPRFQLHPGNKGANLTISDLELSDSATYYCVNQYVNVIDFTEGHNVIVEGSGLTIVQSASQSIQAGVSVTLNCTVHTGWTCDGDHTVYWFRNSGQSQLGLMYSHTGGNKQCERKTNTCFYSFSMKNLNTSHTGTYYCAVAACGHILFGNGTKLVFEDKGNYLVLVYFLSATWIFTIIVVILLTISVYMTKKRNSHHSLDLKSGIPDSPTANPAGNQKEDNIHYAALRANQSNRSRKQKNRQNECVYSTVRS
uniref:Ig-like domain-containing protein n=1 Tax=Takifugu rubripes TaxID=31033 RepID=A0A674MIQ1_TAKRU